MSDLQSMLTVHLSFAGFGFVVLAAFAVSGWLRGKAERRQARERQWDNFPALLPRRPAAYPPEVQARQPAPFPPLPRQPTAPAPVSSAELRRWARNSGLRIADRGPIPRHVREAWAQVHR
jgi:hypothetical protein